MQGLYERLAGLGFEYGPAFQGLGAAWSVGEEVYAEVSLAEEQQGEAKRFGVHPALLDAALHTIGLTGAEEQGLRLPFAWSDVCLQGEGATQLRVRLSPQGEGAFALTLTDSEGAADRHCRLARRAGARPRPAQGRRRKGPRAC